jgi:hypothetical protein
MISIAKSYNVHSRSLQFIDSAIAISKVSLSFSRAREHKKSLNASSAENARYE